MGTVSQFHGRTRSPAHRIDSEEEALETAAFLRKSFATGASERDVNRILPYDELDRLWQSGLGAIAVPAEYGGLDVPNMLLAEVVALIASGDSSIGDCLAVHFSSLETLRSHEAAELKTLLYERVLVGDRFADVRVEEPIKTLIGKNGFRLSGQGLSAPCVLYADWLAVTSHDGATTAYVARDSQGLHVADDWDGMGQRINGQAATIFDDVAIDAGALLRNGPDASGTTRAITELLQAAVDLGIARAALDDFRARGGAEAATGMFSLRLDMLSGALETAGRKLDAAEVNAGETAIRPAIFAAAAVGIAASAAALEIANAIFDLPAGAGGIALNLDRHWRNARIRARTPNNQSLFCEAARHYGHSVEPK